MGRLSKMLAAAAIAALLTCGGLAFGLSAVDWKECEQSGNPDIAIRACNRIIDDFVTGKSDLAKAHEYRGVAYVVRREHGRAIADFTEALRITPRHPGLLTRRAAAFAAKGENDRAIADYTESLRLDPLEARAFAGRGHAYENKGEREKAKADYRAAMAAPAIKAADKKARDAARDRLAALEGVTSSTSATGASGAQSQAKPPVSGTLMAQTRVAAPPRELPQLPSECPKRAEDLEAQLTDFLGWVDQINLDEYAQLRASASDPCKIDRVRLQKLQSDIQTRSAGLGGARVEFYQSCANKEMAKIIDEIKRREPVFDKQNYTITPNRTSILHGRLEKLSNMQVTASKKSEAIIRISSRMKSLSDWARDVVRDCAF